MRTVRLTSRPVNRADPSVKKDGRHHVGGGCVENLVQRAQGYASDELCVALFNLSLGSRERLDHVTGLHIPVSALLRDHCLWRQLEFHYQITVLWSVSHLMS